MTELSTDERARLARLEGVIETGLATFIQVGNALLEIREAKLYRQSHSSFEAYLHERWGMSRTHGNRLVRAACVVHELEPTGSIPTSERQTRELAPFLDDPPKLRRVWTEGNRQAAERGVELSASLFRELRGKEPKPVTSRFDVATEPKRGQHLRALRLAVEKTRALAVELDKLADTPPESVRELGGWDDAEGHLRQIGDYLAGIIPFLADDWEALDAEVFDRENETT